MEQAMTREQFLAHAQEWLWGEEGFGGAYETLAEIDSQYRSECAMFGDAGPGQAIAVRELRAEISKVERQIARLSR